MTERERHVFAGTRTLAEAAKIVEAAARHKQWHWCRRRNGFSDMPLWREVAEALKLPLYQVQAFVHRLEEIANEAGNKGLPRGFVGHFRPTEMAAATGMSPDDAARIYAALEAPEIGWIVSDHVADFTDPGRNPDTVEDPEDVRLRKRRSRARTEVLKKVAQLVHRRLCTDALQTQIVLMLKGLPDAALFGLQGEVASAALIGRPLSTGHIGHIVTRCDIVTVTTEQTSFIEPAVDNSGDVRAAEPAGRGPSADLANPATRGEVQGLPKDDAAAAEDDPQAAALAWLHSTGLKIITERLDEPKTLADTRMQRWLHQSLKGDAVALRAIIESVRASDLTVARFLAAIGQGIEQARAHATAQRALPLGPTVIARNGGKAAGGAA